MAHEQIALWTETSSDPELIAGVRAGDAAAFGVLYERHCDAARKVAAQYTNTPSDIDDVVSESFSRVLRALQQGDGPDLAFRAYLFTIVRRAGMDLINRGIRTRPREDMQEYESALGYEAASDEPAFAGFEQSVVADAFRSLPERWQAVLWYTEVEKKSPKDIAPLLGLSANGVAALSYRAREALRQAYLQQHLATATDINCLEASTQLGAYVRGGLSRRETARVEDHLAVCQACSALVDELEDVNKGMRSVIAPLVLGLAGLGALEGGLPIGGALGTGAAGAGLGGGGAAAGAGSGGAAAGTAGAGGGAVAASAGAGVASAAAAAAAAILTTGGASANVAGTVTGASNAAATYGSTIAAQSAVTATAGAGAGAAGAAGVGVAAGAGGLFASAGALLLPAAAVVGVASLAVAGASILGVFDPAPTGPVVADPSAPATASPQAEESLPAATTGPTDQPKPSDETSPSSSPDDSTATPPTSGQGGTGLSGTPAGDSGGASTGGSSGGDSGGGTGGDTGGGTGGGSGSPTAAPTLSLAKAPLDYLELPSVNPSIGLNVSNTGDGAATPLLASIQLPAGLTFASPGGGASPFEAVPASRIKAFVGFALTGEFAVGDWSCTLNGDSTEATCTLANLDAAASAQLDLDVDVVASLAPDAHTSFTVTSGDAAATYSVLTGVEHNEEAVDVVYSNDGHLAATHVGATLLGCDQSNPTCVAVMANAGSGTNAEFNNNFWSMRPLNEAGGANNSALTTLQLPAGSTVTYAMLEWSANRHASDSFVGALDSARFRTPGAADYQSITADRVSQTTDPDGRIYYQARADVTNLVKAAGSGQYALADVALPGTVLDPDKTYEAGFALTVVYSNPALGDSRVAIFDGAEWVSTSNYADFTFSTSARADVTLGWTAFEADRGLVGDRIDVDGDNFAPLRWNGSTTSVGDSGNAADATAFGGSHANTLGIDAKMFRTGSVPAGVHAVTVRTSGDNFLLSTLTVTIAY